MPYKIPLKASPRTGDVALWGKALAAAAFPPALGLLGCLSLVCCQGAGRVHPARVLSKAEPAEALSQALVATCSVKVAKPFWVLRDQDHSRYAGTHERQDRPLLTAISDTVSTIPQATPVTCLRVFSAGQAQEDTKGSSWQMKLHFSARASPRQRARTSHQMNLTHTSSAARGDALLG